MRKWRDIFASLGSRKAVAFGGFVSELVKMWHFRSRSPARDHFDQVVAIEVGLVQIGRFPGRARIATSIPVRSMAELAIRLVLKQACAERYVLSVSQPCEQCESHTRDYCDI